MTVKDPGQVLVPGAVVVVAAPGDAVPQTKSTDATGRATFDQLPPADYLVTVEKPDFAPWAGHITAGTRPANLAVALKLSAIATSVHVTARRPPLANSDPNYQLIRTGKLTKVYRVSNLVVTRDAGTFTFHSGSFSFLPPVLGHVTTGVFVGEGNFQLKPAGDLASVHLKRMMDSDSVDEDFTAVVAFFSDANFDEIKLHSEIVDESPDRHEEALKRVRNVIEGRREPREYPSPDRTLLERLLNWEDIPNYDAEILAEIYNGDTGERKGSFRAFLSGKKRPDLRFLVNPHGALPILQGPEEVALINFNPNSYADGIWYFSHTLREIQARGSAYRPDSKEDKRLLAPNHYKIDAVLGSPKIISTDPDLSVTCSLDFHALQDGVRMVKLDLLPDLQVSRVVWNGAEIPFVQESRSHDGSFYLQTPEPLKQGTAYNVTFEYAGGEIVQSKFHGGVPPPKRIWYPTPAGPASRATYDLTFHIPGGSKIITVGNQVGQGRDGFWDTSQWKADAPIEQAVFRWVRDSRFRAEVEETTKTRMSMYEAVKAGAPFLPPSSDYMLGDVANALRLFTSWFGKSSYDTISVMVGRGDASLPGIVYVPPVVMAGLPALTARVGAIGPNLQTRLPEEFPALMAGQWWENTLTPASFHDAWLADGLEGFSASVYDLAAVNPAFASNSELFKNRWDSARETLLSRNRYGVRPNDAGPIFMGLLNNVPSTPNAATALNTAKGAYIAQMLRSMMWDPQTLDHDFQAMMQDFVARFANQTVSGDDFQSVVEKHMKPVMDLEANHKMNWFFGEWLYGTDSPSYRVEYSLRPGENGDTLIEAKLTQSGVSQSFGMPVPIFAERAGKTYRIAVVAIRGNSTTDFKATLSARPEKILLKSNHDVLPDKEEVIASKNR